MKIGNIEFQRIENIDEIFDSDIINISKGQAREIIGGIRSGELGDVYERIYALVQNFDLIESSKKKQKIAVECLCITENVLRRMSEKYPQLVEKEIKSAISAARENNKDKILTLNEKVKDYTAKNTKLIEDVENFDESNKKIKPKKVEIRNFYQKKISELNDKLIQKAEIKIEVNNMNVMISENKRQLIGIEEDILFLEEDISGEQARHDEKVGDLTSKLALLEKEIMEAQSSHRIVKEESDTLLAEYLQLKDEGSGIESRIEGLTEEIQKIRDGTVAARNETLGHVEEIQWLQSTLPIIAEKNKREVEIYNEKVEKYGKWNGQLKQNIESYKERRKAGMAVLLGAERDHGKVVDKLTKASKSTEKTKEKLDKFKIMYLGKMEERSQVKRQIKEFELSLEHIIKTATARENKAKTEIRQLQHLLNKEMKEMRTLEHVKNMEEMKSQAHRGKVAEHQQQIKGEIKQFKAKLGRDREEAAAILARFGELGERLRLLEERLPLDQEELTELARRIRTETGLVEGEVAGIGGHLSANREIIGRVEGEIRGLIAELTDKQRRERKLKDMILGQKREMRTLEGVLPEISGDVEGNNREREYFSGEARVQGIRLMELMKSQNDEILGINRKIEMNKIMLSILNNEKNKLKRGISGVRADLEEFNGKMGMDAQGLLGMRDERVLELESLREEDAGRQGYEDMLGGMFRSGEVLEEAIRRKTCGIHHFLESFQGNISRWSATLPTFNDVTRLR